MRLETRQSLLDIREAVQEIQSIAASGELSRTEWLAVERLLMIVGECLIRVRHFEPDVLDEITDAMQIIGLRNVLVHGYDSVDQSRLDDAVRKNLPVLLAEVSALIGPVG